MKDFFVYNTDCIEGMPSQVASNSIDLIFTDPPYGIQGSTLDKHYARDDSCTLPGYVDIPVDQYYDFSVQWIGEAERCLRPGGSIYIVSGYTCLRDILNAAATTKLHMVNHLIAHYTFGVSTKKKWVSSHYHILYYCKPPTKLRTFNPLSRFSDHGDSYTDRLSVQNLKRDYKPGQVKNKNQLPQDFVEKYIQYSSNRGDIVMDPFMGGFTTAFAALRLGRKVVGFEINQNAFNHFVPTLDKAECLPEDPPPVDPSPEVLKQRLKKRAGYKRQRDRLKKKAEVKTESHSVQH
jgi:site-specific DNA-methyltransferase (adenine-specific)